MLAVMSCAAEPGRRHDEVQKGLAAQRSPTERAVPFQAGETLTYDIAWSTFLTAGSATLSVREDRSGARGRTAYDLVAEGRPVGIVDTLYHVYYKAESLLDAQSLLPTAATLYSDDRGRTKLRTTRFVGPTSVEFQASTNAPVEKKAIPPSSRDPLSAIYFLRSMSFQAGRAFTTSIVDGADVYNARWEVAGPQSVSTPVGTFSAWRLMPTLSSPNSKPVPNYRLTLWLSNDVRRLPLKLEADLTMGTFALTLTKVAR
jgi:hypothetical protein